MIRVFVVIALLFAAVFGLDWLGTVPVNVAIAWPGGAANPPFRVVAVSALVFALVIILVWKLVSAVLRSPGMIGSYFDSRRRDKGYRALSQGMIAVGSGDVRQAVRFKGEAARLIGQEPLVLLLDAQAAQIEGRSEDARAAFSRMLEKPETRLLGLRGLFVEATRAGEIEAARHYASEAQALQPGLPWAGTAVMEYQSSEADWKGALATLDANSNARLIDKGTAKRQRAVLLTARALQVEEAEPDNARGFAMEAHRLVPDFVPAAVTAARVLTRLQDFKRAAKIIETTWKLSPHPELAEVYLHVRTGDSARDRLKRAEMLDRLKPFHIEGAVAVARAALDARDFKLAREQLAKALRQSPTRRICLLMADLEEMEHDDAGRVREWLGRAVRAPRDEAWTADGIVSEGWQPTSPVTGRLDAFEWRVPVTGDQGADALDGSALADHATRPLAPPAPPVEEPVAEFEIEAVEPATPPVMDTPPPPASPVPPVAAAPTPPVTPVASASVAPVKPAASDKPNVQFVRFPTAHAPDDPGPNETSDRNSRVAG